MEQQNEANARSRSLTSQNGHCEAPFLCGLVLAGGEGKRLRSFIHLLRQDLLPKQYVNFIGRRSMLEHALGRAERLIPAERVFTIINRSHLEFPAVQRQISGRRPDTVIIQPENKETGPGILLSLMHITRRYPNAIVALLPSDHFVLEEEPLMSHIRRAYLLVKRNPSQIMMLGIKPDHEEPEYGYILPGTKVAHNGKTDIHEIAGFVEKPALNEARRLIGKGALWSTMMMVFAAGTLWRQVRKIAPQLCNSFQTIYNAIGTSDEESIAQRTYDGLQPVNFSKELLEPIARERLADLRVLPVQDVTWSDWGSEVRVMEVLRKSGYASRLNGLMRAPLDRVLGIPGRTQSAQGALSEELRSPAVGTTRDRASL